MRYMQKHKNWFWLNELYTYTTSKLTIIILTNQRKEFLLSAPGSAHELLYLQNLDLLVIPESSDFKAKPPPVRFCLWFILIAEQLA